MDDTEVKPLTLVLAYLTFTLLVGAVGRFLDSEVLRSFSRTGLTLSAVLSVLPVGRMQRRQLIVYMVVLGFVSLSVLMTLVTGPPRDFVREVLGPWLIYVTIAVGGGLIRRAILNRRGSEEQTDMTRSST